MKFPDIKFFVTSFICLFLFQIYLIYWLLEKLIKNSKKQNKAKIHVLSPVRTANKNMKAICQDGFSVLNRRRWSVKWRAGVISCFYSQGNQWRKGSGAAISGSTFMIETLKPH